MVWRFYVNLTGFQNLSGLHDTEALEVDQLRIAFIQILDEAALPVAQLVQQSLHGRVGLVRGSEELGRRAGLLHVLHQG